MARELKGLVAGLAAGLGVVGIAYGVSAVGTRAVSAETKQSEAKQSEAKQAVPSEPKLPAGGQTASAQLVATGRTLYRDACAGCHGQQGQGQVGPSLHRLGDPDAKIARNIVNGFPPRMPAFKGQYGDAQIKALVAYIQSLK